MRCGKAKEVVVSEMLSMLNYIEIENTRYEKEKNELKASYQNRPQDKKNIVKDILTMHTEFDGDVVKMKEIVDELKKIPIQKSYYTEKAEEIASSILELQTELTRRHDTMQKLLIQKINLESANEELAAQMKEKRKAIDFAKKQRDEAESYEIYEDFARKVKSLNAEVKRLKVLLTSDEETSKKDREHEEISSYRKSESNIIILSEEDAEKRLRKERDEVSRLEDAIQRINTKSNSEQTEYKSKKVLEDKKKRISNLKMVLSRSKGASRAERRYEGSNLLTVDSIMVNRDITAKSASPRRNDFQQNRLLQDIEATLSRVRSIASPIPRK